MRFLFLLLLLAPLTACTAVEGAFPVLLDDFNALRADLDHVRSAAGTDIEALQEAQEDLAESVASTVGSVSAVAGEALETAKRSPVTGNGLVDAAIALGLSLLTGYGAVKKTNAMRDANRRQRHEPISTERVDVVPAAAPPATAGDAA